MVKDVRDFTLYSALRAAHTRSDTFLRITLSHIRVGRALLGDLIPEEVGVDTAPVLYGGHFLALSEAAKNTGIIQLGLRDPSDARSIRPVVPANAKLGSSQAEDLADVSWGGVIKEESWRDNLSAVYLKIPRANFDAGRYDISLDSTVSPSQILYIRLYDYDVLGIAAINKNIVIGLPTPVSDPPVEISSPVLGRQSLTASGLNPLRATSLHPERNIYSTGQLTDSLIELLKVSDLNITITTNSGATLTGSSIRGMFQLQSSLDPRNSKLVVAVSRRFADFNNINRVVLTDDTTDAGCVFTNPTVENAPSGAEDLTRELSFTSGEPNIIERFASRAEGTRTVTVTLDQRIDLAKYTFDRPVVVGYSDRPNINYLTKITSPLD